MKRNEAQRRLAAAKARFNKLERAKRTLDILADEYADRPHEGFPGRVVLARVSAGRWCFKWDNLPMSIYAGNYVTVGRAEYARPITYFTTTTVNALVEATRNRVRDPNHPDAYSERQPLGLLLPEAWDQLARVMQYRVLPLQIPF